MFLGHIHLYNDNTAVTIFNTSSISTLIITHSIIRGHALYLVFLVYVSNKKLLKAALHHLISSMHDGSTVITKYC